MRQRSLLLLLALLLPAAFLAGWLANRGGGKAEGTGERQVLYWVDPMNPAFRSPEPGTAPCGMPLEPVYADGAAPGGTGAAAAPGAIVVPADRLQLIGVAREPVRSRTVRHTLRLVGTVAADETRLYAVSAAAAGRALEMGAATTGSLVARGQILGSYYSQELIVPQQNFIRLNDTTAALRRTGANKHDNRQGGTQGANYERNLLYARQALLNLGMSPEQIEEVASRREVSYLIQIRAPAAGILLERRLTLGQAFSAGDELFRIADLGSVWVLADALGGEERLLAPGMPAMVSLPGTGQTLPAAVSQVLPRFAAETRTLKIRLEARNPGLVLRPDMFVDVELPVEVGPAFFLPKEAVLDSGTRQVVFVEQAPGVFAPRTVRTGRRFGEQVEIVAGLMEGETAVTSGNFLLDSESRMRAAGAAADGSTALDPICGMEVEEAKARAQGLLSEHAGRSWYFCAPACKAKFERDPKAAAARAGDAAPPDLTRPPPQSASAVLPKQHATTLPHDAAAHSPMDRPAGMPAEAGDPGPEGGPAGWQAPLPLPRDPVCGMEIELAAAVAAGLVSEHAGEKYYFCAAACKKEFDATPEVFVQSSR